jgi:hypothetical protein
MTVLISFLRITTKEETLLWMHLLGINTRSSDPSLRVGLCSILFLCLICLQQSLRYLMHRFRQPTLAQRFLYLLYVTLDGFWKR